MKPNNYIISGGGTGGHIFPALAIADAIKQDNPDAQILFIGAKGKMEMQRVPKSGYPIKGLWISGIQRKLDIKNLIFPLKLVFSLIKASRIILNQKPSAVIGTGGFASAPTLKAAQFLGYPTLVQEQNSYAGVTNKWLGPKAQSICVAYQGMDKYFPAQHLKLTGNPIRKQLLSNQPDSQKAKKAFGLDSKTTLFILGGSLGSKRINQLINEHLDWFKSQDIQLIWQTGALYYELYKSKASPTIKVTKFIDHMDTAYAAADVIISRAGAGTVSELAIVGKPVLFIPSPNVAENHQYKNAKSIQDQNAALVIEEKDLNQDFKTTFQELINHKSRQEDLAANFKKLAKPGATNAILKEIKRIENTTDL